MNRAFIKKLVRSIVLGLMVCMMAVLFWAGWTYKGIDEMTRHTPALDRLQERLEDSKEDPNRFPLPAHRR